MPSLSIVALDGTVLAVLRPAETSANDPIVCTQFDVGSPRPRESVQERAGSSGDFDLTNFHGSREITADLRLRTIDATTKEDSLAVLSALSAPGLRYYVYFQRNGWDSPRRMLVRATNLSCVSNRDAALMFSASMSWRCPSGVMEALDLQFGNIIPSSSEPLGLSFVPEGDSPDPVFPGWILWGEDGVAFSSGTSADEVTITNTGNTDTPINFKIYGQCADPVITNITSGQEFALNTAIPSTQWLQVDSDTKTVRMNAEPNQSFYSSIDWYRSKWLVLVPGANRVSFSAGEMNDGCHLEIYYRSRWL